MLKLLRGTDDHGAVTATGLTIGTKAVASAEGDEELALPRVGQRVEELLVLVARTQLGEAGANALGCAPGGLALSGDVRAGVQGLDLSELLEQGCDVRESRR